MIYQDRIYGEIEIEEPVILELIEAPSLQRLKGLTQIGYNKRFLHTRFEHSLGVYFLLKKFQAPLEEQIAGLIHDVSHTVFCHMGDYIFSSGSEEKHTFQDEIFKRFVEKTKIPEILEKFNFKLDYILDDKNFPLKEKPLPDLCADRIDYFLRDGFVFREISKEEIEEFLNNFEILDNQWVFKDYEVARKFAEKYSRLNNLFWASVGYAGLMYGAGRDLIKYCFSKNYLEKKDVFSTDREVMEKIEKLVGQDKKLDELLKRMKGEIKWRLDKDNYDIQVICKSRVVDPLFKDKDKIKKVSKISQEWLEMIEKESQPKEYYIKFK